jgi:hypothetical protein
MHHMHGRVDLLVLSPIAVLNVSVSAFDLDERQYGVALRSLAATPTGPMRVRGNGEAIKYWARMTRKIVYGTAMNYGRDAILAHVYTEWAKRTAPPSVGTSRLRAAGRLLVFLCGNPSRAHCPL